MNEIPDVDISKLATMDVPALRETLKKVHTVTWNNIDLEINLFQDNITLVISNPKNTFDIRYVRFEKVEFFRFFFLIVKVITEVQKVRNAVVQNIELGDNKPLDEETLKLISQNLSRYLDIKNPAMAEAYAQFVIPSFKPLYEAVAINLKDINGVQKVYSPLKVIEAISKLNEKLIQIMIPNNL
ncbi:MAG: hypothetical protein ABIM99_03985 [Candidatus Dojkabacteria bacterium]